MIGLHFGIHTMAHSAWQPVLCSLCLVFWILGVKAMSFDSSTLDELLGDAVLAALMLAKITIKEAALVMEIDEAQFRRQLQGGVGKGSHLSLNRLIRLKFEFWVWFSPSLIYLVAKRNVREIAEDLHLRKVV